MATKKALIVGLNYPGTKKALKCGVVNARKVKKYLEKYLQFQPEHITLLTDEVKFVQIEAFDICKQLYMMIKDAKDDDILFYYFCGHGGRYKAKDANNSGYVEYMVGSGKTHFKDTHFRDFVEMIPAQCSFTAVVDSCRSGGILEGANEVVGQSTRSPSIYVKRAEKDKKFNFGEPTGHPLGIVITACQNHQSSIQIKFKDKGKKTYGTFFTKSFLEVIKETNGDVSNLELVQCTGQKMNVLLAAKTYREARAHNPGLYCDDDQKDLIFLSHEMKAMENEDDDDDEVENMMHDS